MKQWASSLGVVVAVLLLLGLSPAPLAAQPGELQTGTAMALANLSIHAETSGNSERLGAVVAGELVTILEIEEAWARISYGDIEGWTRLRTLTMRDALINVNGPAPLPRTYHVMAYDAESDRIILFGGIPGHGTHYNDTWAYDVSANTWTRMSPAAAPADAFGPMAYDAQSDRVIFFAGRFGWEMAPLPTETWTYDFNTDTWTNMEPATAPPALIGSRLAYDSESDRIILFGGIEITDAGSEFVNRTWTYDVDSNTWAQMAPATSPPAANYVAMGYDARADRVVVTGLIGNEQHSETWLYDYNTDTWEMRETVENPGPRVYTAMVYADATDQMILFGSGPELPDMSLDLRADTWAYDCATNVWTLLQPDQAPPARAWHAMAYNSAAELVVLFGGGSDREEGSTMETWLYDPNANTWTQVGP